MDRVRKYKGYEPYPNPDFTITLTITTYLPCPHRRTGRGRGQLPPPPIRAVCRHEFGQRVDIIRAKHNTCLNNMNFGSVTAVNGEKHEFRVCLLQLTEKFCHPTEYGSRKISATTPPPPPQNRIPENLCYYAPPPR